MSSLPFALLALFSIISIVLGTDEPAPAESHPARRLVPVDVFGRR